MSARENTKETADSIIVAFILAFVFRAFIVEAFVIPTGSMAATLYGKHGTITCRDCGWEFAYGLNDPGRLQQIVRPGQRIPYNAVIDGNDTAVCQNCNYPNTNLKTHDVVAPRGNAEAGDRILVLKWPLDVGLDSLEPQRWDVTVFKNPTDRSQNFIKRLTGLPNEVLEIIDGDVYAAPFDALSDDTKQWLDEARHVKYVQRNNESADGQLLASLRDRQAAMFDDLNRHLRIQRKTPAAQRSLWINVYNHDFPPHATDRPNAPRWETAPEDAPEDGADKMWRSVGRKLVCTCQGATAPALRFAGKSINDFLAYNVSANGDTQVEDPVSDVRIRSVLLIRGGSGALRYSLTKRADTFHAEINVDGSARLLRESAGAGEPELVCATQLTPLQVDQPVEVSFELLDYRASLIVDGQTVLATNDKQYAPVIEDIRNQEPPKTVPPQITARDLHFELWHVILDRDVYYAPPEEGRSRIDSARAGWGTTNHPIWLREGEYFMLGDNTRASADSRLWESVGAHLSNREEAYQLGTVPRDQIIGRAFFVYWPSGLRSELLPVLGDYGVIPNFGRMRWIR